MSFPAGVSKVTLTIGTALAGAGTEATFRGTVAPIFGGTVHSVLWQATGDTYNDVPEAIPSNVSGVAAVDVPAPHQTGWVIPVVAAGGATVYQQVTDWGYLVDGILQFRPDATAQRRRYRRIFKVPPGTTEIDVDTVGEGQVTGGVQGPYVSVVDPDAIADAVQAWFDTNGTGGGPGGPVAWADVTGKPTTFPPATHSHTLDATTDTATRVAMTPAERTKLTSVMAGATQNATDAALRDRGTHTGTQTAASISDLTETVQDIVASLIVAGTNVSVNYNDAANTFTINASGGGGGGGDTDPEIVRDVIGAALVAGSGIQIAVNDAGDSITIASTAVLPTRQIVSGTGLTGGGDLSADRTLAVAYGTTAGTAAQGNDARLSDSRPPTAHNHPAAQISDSTSIGRAVVTATDAAAARTAIGAGTSNLALGSTGSTAAPGNHTHTSAQITDLAATINTSVSEVASELGDEAVARTQFGSQDGTILSPWKESPAIGPEMWTASNFTPTGSANNTTLTEFINVPRATNHLTNAVMVGAVGNGDTAFRLEFDYVANTTGSWSVSMGLVGTSGVVSRQQVLAHQDGDSSGHVIFEFQPPNLDLGWYIRFRVVHENNAVTGDTLTVNNITLRQVGRMVQPLTYFDETSSGAARSIGFFLQNPQGVQGYAEVDLWDGINDIRGYRTFNPFSNAKPDPWLRWEAEAGNAAKGGTWGDGHMLRWGNNDQILNVLRGDGEFELRANAHGGETIRTGAANRAMYIDRGDGVWRQWAGTGRFMKRGRRARMVWNTQLQLSTASSPFAEVDHTTTCFQDGVMRTDRQTRFLANTTVGDYFEWMTSHQLNQLWFGRLGKAQTVIGECDTSIRLVAPNPTISTSGSGGTLPSGAKSYRITVVSPRGESDPSLPVSASTSGTTSTVTLTWAAVTGAVGYRIYGRVAGFEILLATVGTVTTWTDTGAAIPTDVRPPTVNRASTTTPNVYANVTAHDATWAAWYDPTIEMCFGNIFDRDAAAGYPGVAAVKARIEQAPGITKNYQNLYYTGGSLTNTFTAGTALTATHWAMVWIPESQEEWHREIANRAANLNALKVMYPST